VLEVTLRLRREGGKVSWALLSYGSADEAQVQQTHRRQSTQDSLLRNRSRIWMFREQKVSWDVIG